MSQSPPSTILSEQFRYTPNCQWAGNCPFTGTYSHSTEALHPDEPGHPSAFPEWRQLLCRKTEAARLVGIPTIEGMEFLKTKELIRCEGMQRLTRVYTVEGVLLSSYNIGEFCRLLCHCGFFSPHKSHLINLQFLRSYSHDGVITLRDGSQAPLARRRKQAFLERVRHL